MLKRSRFRRLKISNPHQRFVSMASSCWRAAKEAKVEESTTATTTVPNWVELPRDVTAKILHKLGAIEILTSAQHVCCQWRDICKDPLMWRTIDMHTLATSHQVFYEYDLETMCRDAVDRSCGHLEDIRLGLFGSNALLKYISHSTSHLRSIWLAYCGAISDKGLIVVAEKLPLLEELDISFCYLSKDSLEAIGRCCPRLRSLKFNMNACTNQGDEEAFAIANTMPKLHYLQLLENKLTNAGLLAILDGCPLLEYLDLRACINVYLGGSLGERCAEQIKELRLPNDIYHYADFLFGWWTRV